MLQDLTGIPTVATLPMWWQHGLPEEDGVFDDRSVSKGAVNLTVAVIAYPRISNLDEFQPLKNIPGLRLQWVRSPSELAGLKASDWIILPGSKHTSGRFGLVALAGLGCGHCPSCGAGWGGVGHLRGLQMLGEALIDPHGIDGNAPGLGLLPLVTVFAEDKTVRHTSTRFSVPLQAHSEGEGGSGDAGTVSPWAALSGVTVSGYEIHHGQTAQHAAMAAAGNVAQAVLPHDLGWCNAAGNVMGVYLHGMLEDAAVLQALFGARLQGEVPTLDKVFDGLADYIGQHFAPGVLDALVARQID